MRHVVLLSGGIDSTTVLGLVAEETLAEILCLSISYGQRHQGEVKAASNVAARYGFRHKVVHMNLPGSDSVLMNPGAEMPQMTYEELEKSEGVSPTYVPFRNGNLISRAVSEALEQDAERVWVGVHAEDARGWAYPDCTPEFIGAMANAVYVGTYHKVRLLAPLQYLLKRQVVEIGLGLNVPYDLTRSCYEAGNIACGKCPTCVSRLEAFRANDAVDPIAYEIGVR
jgi:7-cyano-7-deazaguanine synthase